MSDADLIDQTLAVIKKRGAIRTSALALALRYEGYYHDLDEALQPAVDDGRLICCKVELGGDFKTKEYRLSVSGGGKVTGFTPLKGGKPTPPVRPSVLMKTETTPGTEIKPSEINETLARQIRVTAPAPTADAEPREEEKVSLVDKIIAAFKKHGPMTTRELRAHVDHPNMPKYCSQLADRGTLGRLGGGKRSTIYGLPDQKAPEAKTDKPPRAIHRKKARKHAKKRAGGGSVAMRRKRALNGSKKAVKATFRPALAADGAILFIGAHRGDFEIPRAEARVMVSLVRQLTGDELVKAVDFIERLDNAEVGA